MDSKSHTSDAQNSGKAKKPSSQFPVKHHRRYRLTRSDLLCLIWGMEHDHSLNAPIGKIELLKHILASNYKVSPASR